MKFGGWYHAGLFNDQRFASNGLSQADANASPFPAQIKSDFGVYAVFQQTLAEFAGRESERGIGAFTRVSASPNDQNLINFYADAGVVVIGLSASRPDDQFGIAVA